MKFRSLALGLVLAAVGAAIVWTVRAQQSPDPVVARVDGVEIRESDLALAESDIGGSLPPGTPEQRREALVTYMIDVSILARAAEAKKLAEGPEFARRLAYVRAKTLMETLLENASKSATTEENMRKLYDDSVKKLTPEKEVRARHILVESEDKAKEVLAKLKAGGDFLALAKEYSKDPGSAEGGDLGYFAKGQMVPEFAEAAFKMEKGQVSEAPVKTQFGFHIIKVEDVRDRPVPPYETVKDQIERFVVQRAQTELVMKAREAAKIEKIGAPTAAPAPAPATPPAAPAPDKK
jgi:peptidyl-prolyl cis-trans isomerase C